MGIKIGISGAFSSGKTTLFDGLTSVFPQLTGYPELASDAKIACPTLNWWHDDVRGYLRWAQIIAEFKCQSGGGIGLFDGSFADLIAHERAFGSRLPAIEPESIPAPYRVTFLCDSSEIDVEVNGIRETDRALRQRIQLLVEEEALRSSDRVIALKGDRQTRLDKAVAVLAEIVASQRFG